MEDLDPLHRHQPARPLYTLIREEPDWAAIIGMRNTLIHQYWRTDLEVVNEVLDKDLAPLATALRSHTDE